MNPQPLSPTPPPQGVPSAFLGAVALLLMPLVLALLCAGTFWACGVAGRAFHWMLGGF